MIGHDKVFISLEINYTNTFHYINKKTITDNQFIFFECTLPNCIDNNWNLKLKLKSLKKPTNNCSKTLKFGSLIQVSLGKYW